MTLSRRESILVVAFWVFLAVVSVANRLQDPRRPGMRAPLAVPLAITLTQCGLWAALTPLVFRFASALSRQHAGWAPRLAALLSAGLVLSLLVAAAVTWVRTDVLQIPGPRAGSFASEIAGFVVLNEFILYLGLVAAGFAREFFQRYRRQIEEAAALRAEAAELHARLAESQLAALRMQLNPHFLFNTLHAVSALVGSDPSGVRKMITRLSELLRAALEQSAQPLRTVEAEMAFIMRYLEIMEVRFEGALEVRTEVDEAARDALVPTLVLQPLVENAIKHGVSTVGRGRVDVTVRRLGERVRLAVVDDGPGLSTDPQLALEKGVGLRNTRARLEQMYGAEQRFTLARKAGGGTTVEVELPYRAAAEAGG